MEERRSRWKAFFTRSILAGPVIKADNRLCALGQALKRQHGNCITLVRIVIAPTAISPPYFNRLVLKQTDSTLSVNCMIKGARPSDTQVPMMPGSSFIF